MITTLRPYRRAVGVFGALLVALLLPVGVVPKDFNPKCEFVATDPAVVTR